MNLHLETHVFRDATILHCKGRIVFRDEVAALSRAVAELLRHSHRLVLDFTAVETIDSAGLGELVLLHMWAEGNGALVKFAGPSAQVQHLFKLTNLVSVLDVYPTVEDALAAFPAAVFLARSG